RTHQTGGSGDLHLGYIFNGLAKGGGMAKAGVAGDTLCQTNALGEGFFLKKLFGPFVSVKKSYLQIEDGLARHAKAEVSRLDRPRVQGGHRYVTHSLSRHE